MSKVRSSGTACYAQGGAVHGKVSEFMKTENEFTEADTSQGSDEDWGKGGKGPANPKPANKQIKRGR